MRILGIGLGKSGLIILCSLVLTDPAPVFIHVELKETWQTYAAECRGEQDKQMDYALVLNVSANTEVCLDDM